MKKEGSYIPCYQVQTMSVNLNKANHDLLEKALKKLGYTVTRNGTSFSFRKGEVTGNYANDKLTMTSPNKSTVINTDEIKVEYSKQLVLKMVEKKRREGWETRKEGDEYVLRRDPTSGTVQA